MKKPKLPSIPKIKKALIADWSLRVRARDGFKCLLCSATENLTAHHWYVSDHHAHTARYAIANGATLCYACHIRGIHQRADYVSVEKVANALKVTFETMRGVALLVEQEITTPLLRELWDAMRKRPVNVRTYQIGVKGGKVFAWVEGPQKAVVGNTMTLNENPTVYSVDVAVNVDVFEAQYENTKMYRYTLKKLEDGE